MTRRIVLASANPKKVAELQALLEGRFVVEPRPADLADTVEDGDTLEANAIKKASEVAAATGAIALADDTGLFVEALGGAPGVRSARYAADDGDADSHDDAANVAKLLRELDAAGAVERDDRRAEFRTVVAVLGPDGAGITAEGSVTGLIAPTGRGDNGFGYDPVFEPDEGEGRTFAQMTAEEKASLSHRARALASLELALGQAADALGW